MKKGNIRISLDISEELNTLLRDRAVEEGESLNSIVRLALERFLKTPAGNN